MVDPVGTEPKKSGSGMMPWLLGGCCCLMLLVPVGFFALGGMAAFGVIKAVQAYQVEALAFMAEAEAGNFDAAYARFSTPLKHAQSLEAFRAGVQANPDLFQVQGMSLSGINADGTTGVTRVHGTVTSKSGKVRHCVFGYLTEGGVLKLSEYQISDTPLPE